MDALYPSAFPGKVAIRLKGGEVLRHEVAGPRGSPQNPMGFEEVSEKFRQLTAGILPEKGQEALIAFAGALEEQSDLGALVEWVG
ncbi:MAG: hypothetical protein ACE5JS_20385 [Nitrospinota bacterium]